MIKVSLHEVRYEVSAVYRFVRDRENSEAQGLIILLAAAAMLTGNRETFCRVAGEVFDAMRPIVDEIRDADVMTGPH